jgi:6-phosphogluconolactonase (cycloisomerase 2 family)
MIRISLRGALATGVTVFAVGCPSDSTGVGDTDASTSTDPTTEGSTSLDPDGSSSTSDDPTTSTSTTIDPDTSETSTDGTSTDTGVVGCGDGIVDAVEGERCDGRNLDGRDCITEGFAGGVLACNDDCTLDTSGCTSICGDGRIAADEDCEGNDLGGGTCTSEGFDGGDLGCGADCTFDTSACEVYVCGDGVVAGPEVCDGVALEGSTCVTLGFDSGTLACADDCGSFDTSDCHVCGDGVIDEGEDCDGNALGGQTCVTQGADGGVLACNADCTFDLDACTGCGNGDQDPGEDCDGNDFGGTRCDDFGFVGGSLTCNAQCGIEATSCFGTHVFCTQPNIGLLGQPSTSTIDVEGLAGVLVDVDVFVDASHTQVGALTLGVQHFESGLGVTLADEVCGAGDDIDATFDQDAPSGPACGPAPTISGDVLPVGSLDAFVDGPVGSGDGTWELSITNASVVDGNLAQWCVELTTASDGESMVYVVNDQFPNSITAYAIADDGTLTEIAGSPFATGGDSSFSHHPDAIASCGAFVYAANYQTNTISGFTVEADGSLTAVPGATFPAAQVVGLACNDTHLFASNFGNIIYRFELDADGSLTDIGAIQDAAFSTLGMTLHRETSRLVVAGWSSNVSVYDVGADGGLTHVPGSPFATGGSNHSASISPNGALVATEGNGAVNVWNVADDGSLTLVPGSPFADPTGCETVGLAWAPDSARLFVGHRGCFPGRVMVYDVADDGTLLAVPGAPFETGGNSPVGLAVGSDGTRLFASHGSSQDTSVLDIAADGTLTPVAGSPFFNTVGGNHPWLVLR